MAKSTERIQQIQEEIARRAGRPEKVPEDTLTVLAFDLAGERYALPLTAVREVSRVRPITPLPGLPPAVLGAIGLRGEVLAVLDLRRILGLEEPPPTPESRLIVVQHEAVTAAMLADRVEDIAALTGSSLLPPPSPEGKAALVQGIAHEGKRTIRLLDLARLLEAVRHGQ